MRKTLRNKLEPDAAQIKSLSLYDQDFVTWAEHTAHLLRTRRLEEVDIEHVAEEIGDMAGRDRTDRAGKMQPRRVVEGCWSRETAAGCETGHEDAAEKVSGGGRPRPIRNDDELEEAIAMLEDWRRCCTDRGLRRAVLPVRHAPPDQFLKALLEQRGLAQADIAHLLGGSGHTSEVLSGKRSISKDQAKRLGEFFKLSACLSDRARVAAAIDTNPVS